MPLRLPRPSAELVEAFEAATASNDAIIEAVAKAVGVPDDLPELRLPEKFWLLGALPVEGLPKGAPLDEKLMSRLAVRCWRFFVGLDDGGHVECDFRGGGIVGKKYVPPGEDRWLGLLSRASLLWARQTVGNNEARLVEFPWLDVRLVRAVGPDPGVVIDETWEGGDHGAPMQEADFVEYVARKWAEKRGVAA